MRWSGWFAWVALGVASCGTATFIVQEYAGPVRAPSTIGIIRVNAGGPELFAVDGERVRAAPEKGTRLHIEVLPGPHEVGVVPPGEGTVQGIVVRFVADAGKVYRMVLRSALPDNNSLEQRWTAVAVEVDRASDVELGPAAAPPEAPSSSASTSARPP